MCRLLRPDSSTPQPQGPPAYYQVQQQQQQQGLRVAHLAVQQAALLQAGSSSSLALVVVLGTCSSLQSVLGVRVVLGKTLEWAHWQQ
jgi:hypothetical protein